MKDSVIIGSGNSRYLKSVADFKTLYPTYDDFAAALVAGTLPVDFNGINPAGFQQVGDPIAKATLLKDATAQMFGLDASAVPDDVFLYLKSAKIRKKLWTHVVSAGSGGVYSDDIILNLSGLDIRKKYMLEIEKGTNEYAACNIHPHGYNGSSCTNGEFTIRNGKAQESSGNILQTSLRPNILIDFQLKGHSTYSDVDLPSSVNLMGCGDYSFFFVNYLCPYGIDYLRFRGDDMNIGNIINFYVDD